jgi:hypothetical protein
MPLTRAQRSLVGQIGIQTRLATEVPAEMTRAARAAFDRRFYDQTDPALPEDERQRRAAALRRAHMTRLALAAATARRRRAQADAALAALDGR